MILCLSHDFPNYPNSVTGSQGRGQQQTTAVPSLCNGRALFSPCISRNNECILTSPYTIPPGPWRPSSKPASCPSLGLLCCFPLPCHRQGTGWGLVDAAEPAADQPRATSTQTAGSAGWEGGWGFAPNSAGGLTGCSLGHLTHWETGFGHKTLSSSSLTRDTR